MRPFCAALSPALLLIPLAANLLAADAHPRVIGWERFYSPANSDNVAAGELLLGELNCTSCHQADAALQSRIQRKQAPVLDTVTSRVQPQYLLKFLADPQATKPGTTMPNVLAGWPEAERVPIATAIVHFLATTGVVTRTNPMRQQVNRGEVLFHTIGCVACHGERKDPAAAPLATSIPLGTPSRKYTLPGMTKFLENPLAVRPGGRMPHLNLAPADARDIASFLLNDLDVASGLQYAYYEGSWDKLPDFSKLTPKEVGDAENFDLKIAKRKDNFALRFDGTIKLEKDGDYRFLIGSDDGSRLWIDDKIVLDNDGIHPYEQKRKAMKMKAGLHTFAVEYFEKGGGEELAVDFEGPGTTQQPLASIVTAPATARGTTPAAEEFVIDPELVAKGKEYFTSLGCASCHDLKQGGGQKIASKLEAPALASLKGTGGCLAEMPGKTPFFALNPRQVETLAAALAAAKSPAKAPLAAADSVTRALIRFNCLACHARGELGGVEEARNPHFQSDMPEMGDEGRIPPSLTGVGAKLTPEWLKTVFDQGAKDRPYMFTRMPKFGSQNVGELITTLEQADAALIQNVAKLNLDPADKKTKAAGRRLVGGQGFSCIKCHTFADKRSTGIQALSLTTMTKRLRPEWFHHYLMNPLAYRPGTRMPTPFPNGQTTLPDVLDGTPPTQIAAIWSFLTDGDKAPLPSGLVTGQLEIVVLNEAVIYRNFIEGAGSRAIGVGYPEKLNLAFDANNDRLALLWQGAFIDAAKHWTGRGQGYQGPLGDNILKLPDGVSFAALADTQADWPKTPAKESGYQFRGYYLTGPARQPVFMYSFGGVAVEDHPVPVGEGDVYALQRKLTLTTDKPAGNLWFRAATAGQIEDTGKGVFKIDGKWTLTVAGTGKPEIRQKGQAELLVPVVFTGNKAEIQITYDW
ncbi:MAG: PA14 domain-containing protein [Pirellulaceae bacterium]|nr:PA14 domain-containing protein [Pirellulaceae bacterium]